MYISILYLDGIFSVFIKCIVIVWINRVIGGGDGGVIRELCKHDTVKEIVWIEIDERVVELSKRYFKEISSVAHNDKRVTLMIDDGINYVSKTAKNKSKMFDVIIVDSSDPEGPASVLFTEKFYENCFKLLHNYGILTFQSECMFETHLTFIKSLMNINKKIFTNKIDNNNHVQYCSSYQPMYPNGQIGFLIARKYCWKWEHSNKIIPLDNICRDIPDKIQSKLKYYSKDMHQASFILPNKCQQFLSKL